MYDKAPDHLVKFVDDYKKNKIEAKDVWMSGDKNLPETLEFKISLPLFNKYGVSLGNTQEFVVDIASIRQTRQKTVDALAGITIDMNEAIATYDELINQLQDIIQKKGD